MSRKSIIERLVEDQEDYYKLLREKKREEFRTLEGYENHLNAVAWHKKNNSLEEFDVDHMSNPAPVPKESPLLYFKNAKLPEPELRKEMRSWNQGDKKWKDWRAQNKTIGASSVERFLGLSKYETPASFAELLKGVHKVGRSKTVFTMIGHLMEEVNVALAIRAIKHLFGVEATASEVGVMYNGKEPIKTASIDRDLKGPSFVFRGKTINLDKSVFECKVPAKSRYKSPSHSHIGQVQWQIEVMQSQDDPHYAQKDTGLLACMEMPFVDIDNCNEVDKEHFILDPNKPWVLKCWVVPHSPEVLVWINGRFKKFITHYEGGYLDYEDKSNKFLHNGGDHIPEDIVPETPLLFQISLLYKGETEVDLNDETSTNKFLDAAVFRILGSKTDTSFSSWRN